MFNDSKAASLVRQPQAGRCALPSMPQDGKSMTLDAVIMQLDSIKDNARSFIGDDSAGIWEADIKACDAATAVLSILLDAGFNSLEQVRELAANRQTSGKDRVAVVRLSKDSVQCIGVFDGYCKAFRRVEKYLWKAVNAKDGNSVIAATEDLGNSHGFRRNLETKDGKVDESIYILRMPQ